MRLKIKIYRKDFFGKYDYEPQYGLIFYNLKRQPTLDLCWDNKIIAIILIKKEKTDD